MQLSIVMPMYNAAKYLKRCLESISISLETAGVNGEIILVDNGSIDGSKELANRMVDIFANKTLALRVVECQTPGAGAARNCGLLQAQSEFVWFIDADDTIAPDAVKKLIAAAKDADLVMMGAERVYQDGHRDYLSAVMPGPGCESRFVRYGMGPWQVMFRRSWWLENGFLFREKVIHEDMELMSALILCADERYAAVDEPLYFYYQTPDSVLHRRSWSEHAYDIFPALEGLYERFRALGAEKRYRNELEWFFIWNLLIDSAKDFVAFPEGRAGFARSREMLSKYFPRWRKNRFLREKPIRLRLRVMRNYYRNK